MRGVRAEPRRDLLTVLLILLAVWLSPTPAAQPCPHNGDVTQDGELTPADALLAFQHFLRVTEPPLAPCQQEHANVHAPEDAAITPADALCIFQAFLGLPSCFDGRPARIEVREGNGAQVVVHTPQRLVVRVMDGSGTPLAGLPVTFGLLEGNGVLSATLASTDSAGEAATTLTVGTTAGANRIEARVEGLEPVVFTVTGVADQDNVRLIEVSRA